MDAATTILSRATYLDERKRLTEAKICYEEGIQLLSNHIKTLPEGKMRQHIYGKINGYLTRAEAIKKQIAEEKKVGSYHEQISIENDSTDNSYDNVFGRFLGSEVTSISVKEPYIRVPFQRQNLLRFCELAVKKCSNLKEVFILTSEDQKDRDKNEEQVKWLNQLKAEMYSKKKIDLSFEISSTLHDRQIKLSNGWIIKIGRGLHYFKAPGNGDCSLGLYDLDLRHCHETVVDVFHRKDVTLKHR